MIGKTLTNTTKIKLLLDGAITLAVLASLSPALTGQAIHEWLGIAVAVPLVVHLLLNWKRVSNLPLSQLERLLERPRNEPMLY